MKSNIGELCHMIMPCKYVLHWFYWLKWKDATETTDETINIIIDNYNHIALKDLINNWRENETNLLFLALLASLARDD